MFYKKQINNKNKAQENEIQPQANEKGGSKTKKKKKKHLKNKENQDGNIFYFF